MKKIIKWSLYILSLSIFLGLNIVIQNILTYFNIDNKYVSYAIYLITTYVYIVLIVKIGDWIKRK